MVILLNPGPTNVSDRVLRAASEPLVCHREPEYFDLQDEVRDRLLRVLGLNPATWAAVLVAGSGTSAVEAMIGAGVPRGRGLLVSVNGVYGDRMAKMASAYGIEVEEVVQPWGEVADPARIAAAIEGRDDLGAVAVVHHETTTGLLNPVEEIGRVVKGAGLAFLVDSVSGLAGDPLDVPASGADLIASTGGKNYQGMPALSFVYAKRSALEAARDGGPRSVYLDLTNLCDKQDRRGTPFTPAVPLVRSLREALVELSEETVDGRVARYRDAALFLRDGYERLGLGIRIPDPAHRSNCLTTVNLPEGRTYDDLHDHLKRAGFVIYSGQGRLEAEAFRIANMGWVKRADYERLLTVLGDWVG
jgi:2-aminoethylphosphonate-pyruvate transaminase